MRLIDADKLLDTLGIDSLDCEKCSWGNFDYCKRGSDFVDACSAIEDAPTVDAVEVVRCKDCKHYFADGCDECQLMIAKSITASAWGKRWYSDFYCAWGERREDDA